ncbi:MAG: hypothetical protein RLZZ210_1530 [Pseudomonadota bacterium]|jgi:hypothetical protein
MQISSTKTANYISQINLNTNIFDKSSHHGGYHSCSIRKCTGFDKVVYEFKEELESR